MADRLASYKNFQDFAKGASNIQASDERGLAIGRMLDGISRRMENYILKGPTYSLKQAASDGTNSPLEYYGTEHYGLHKRNLIRLNRPFNFTAVTSIVDNGTTLTADQFYADYRVGTIHRIVGKFYSQPGAVQVVYTSGFPVTGAGDQQKLAVPDDLTNACLLQAQFEFDRREPGNVPPGATTVSRPDGSIVIKAQAFLDEVQDVLDAWRR